jgi:1-acyl-sn-glycerol-3-phosphate acyltransferase
MSFIFKFLFTLFGWKIVGTVPVHLKKGVFAVCPHSTWKDFILGLGVRAKMGMKIGYIGKAELFKPPFGFIFKWLGGTPAYRTTNNNMVESYVNAINAADDMMFALAPEGTRKNVERLRTGFYYMAHGAGIPITMIGFDFKRKEIPISKPFYTTGNFEEDMKQYFIPFFEPIIGQEKKWLNNYKNNIF